MKALILCCIFVALSVSASAQAQSYGFKDFEVGMTIDAAANVLRTTKWTQDERKDPDQIFSSKGQAYLDLETEETTYNDVEPDDLQTIGCTEFQGKTWCPQFNSITAVFTSGKLEFLRLWGKLYESVAQVAAHGKLIVAAITNKYGAPSSSPESFNKLTDKSIGKFKGDVMFSEWLKPDSSQRIRVEVSRGGKRVPLYLVYVEIIDLTIERELERQRKATVGKTKF